MRRPSGADQGPINIKLGRNDSTRSIEGSDSSPQVHFAFIKIVNMFSCLSLLKYMLFCMQCI